MKPSTDQDLPYSGVSNTSHPVLPTTSRDEVKVNIALSVNDFQRCLPDFINRAISFEVTYDNHNEDKTTQKPIGSTAAFSNNSYGNQSHGIIKQIYQKYIEEYLEKIPPTDVQIAQEFGIKTVTLKKQFKTMYGKTFYQLYMDKKMTHAANLLRQGLKVGEVSARIGYSQPIKFNLIFQKHFGVTPKKYQMQHL